MHQIQNNTHESRKLPSHLGSGLGLGLGLALGSGSGSGSGLGLGLGFRSNVLYSIRTQICHRTKNVTVPQTKTDLFKGHIEGVLSAILAFYGSKTGVSVMMGLTFPHALPLTEGSFLATSF